MPSWKRILVLGDSLPLPRPRHGQPLDETWPAHLKRKHPDLDLWVRAREASTAFDVWEEFAKLSQSMAAFQALIIQVGIVDCCPRPYPFVVERFLRAFLSHEAKRAVNRRLYTFPIRPWISEGKFLNYLETVLTEAFAGNGTLFAVLVGIAPPAHGLLLKLPRAPRYVERYNLLLHDLAKNPKFGGRVVLADPFRPHPDETLLIADGHHLSARGHRIVAESIDACLEQWLLGGMAG